MGNTKILLISAFVLLALGYGAGRYVQPPKEITKVEVQEKEVIRKDIQVVTKEIIRPDGTKEIVTTSTDKSVEKKDKVLETLISKPSEKQWMVGIGASPLKYYETYSVKVDRRILGPFFIGGQYIRNKSDNIGLANVTMEF